MVQQNLIMKNNNGFSENMSNQCFIICLQQYFIISQNNPDIKVSAIKDTLYAYELAHRKNQFLNIYEYTQTSVKGNYGDDIPHINGYRFLPVDAENEKALDNFFKDCNIMCRIFTYDRHDNSLYLPKNIFDKRVTNDYGYDHSKDMNPQNTIFIANIDGVHFQLVTQFEMDSFSYKLVDTKFKSSVEAPIKSEEMKASTVKPNQKVQILNNVEKLKKSREKNSECINKLREEIEKLELENKSYDIEIQEIEKEKEKDKEMRAEIILDYVLQNNRLDLKTEIDKLIEKFFEDFGVRDSNYIKKYIMDKLN